jgi:hypothetical protein
MRCTKCGFISFDFNQVCPKCNRELADEQKKLNLPSFRPDPPQLLGRLVGEGYDADIDIPAGHEVSTGENNADLEINTGLENSFTGLEEDKFTYAGDEEFDVISLEPDEPGLSPSLTEDEGQAGDLNFELEEVPSEESIAASGLTTQNEDEFLDLMIDNEDLSAEPQETDLLIDGEPSDIGIPAAEKDAIEDNDVAFNLDDLSFDDLDLEMPHTSESEIESFDSPLAEATSSAQTGSIEELILEDNPEGLTTEIDMKKFRKEALKGDYKNE